MRSVFTMTPARIHCSTKMGIEMDEGQRLFERNIANCAGELKWRDWKQIRHLS